MTVSVKRVRDVVRCIRNSPARLRKFKEYSTLVGISSNSALSLDVPTRWNSTYMMLQTACIYERAFNKFDEQEISFKADLGEVPEFLDWEAVKKLVDMLKHFYELTMRIFSSQYMTSTSMFTEILICKAF